MSTYVAQVGPAGSLVTWEVKLGSLNITKVANGLSRITCEFDSADASFRPNMDDEIQITKGTALFGGKLNALPESGVFSPPEHSVAIATKVSGNDFGVFASQRYVNETIPAGTLKSFLVRFVTYLTACDPAVTLDPTQVNGPTLPQRTYTYFKLSDALNELTTLTGYVWRIDALKQLSAVLAGTVACPFNCVDGDDHVVLDVIVTPTRNNFYANKVIGVLAPVTKLAFDDHFVGDGVTSTFPLTLTVNDVANFKAGYVTVNSVSETAGSAIPAEWIYNIAVTPQTITRVVPGTLTPNPPPNLASIDIIYDGVLSSTSSASDAGEIAAHGLTEYLLPVKPDWTPAQLALECIAELGRRKILQKVVRVQTYQTGAEPNMSITITDARRNINASCLIQQVVITDQGLASGNLLYTIDALVSPLFQPTWQSVVAQWAQTGGAASVSQSVVSGAGGSPGGFDMSVQFNKGGVFGGDQYALDDYNETGPSYSGPGPSFSLEPGGPARFAVGVADYTDRNEIIQAWFNSFAGAGKELIVAITNIGTAILQTVQQFVISTAQTLVLNAQFIEMTYSRSSPTTDQPFVRCNGLLQLWGIFGRTDTIDAGPANFSLTPSTYFSVLVKTTHGSDRVCTLPDITSYLAIYLVQYSRMCFIKNEGSFNVILTPGVAGQTVNGAGTYIVAPGQGVFLMPINNSPSDRDWHIFVAGSSVASGSGGGGGNAILTADPSTPSDDTYWMTDIGTTPTRVIALKARIAGATYVVSSITL